VLNRELAVLNDELAALNDELAALNDEGVASAAQLATAFTIPLAEALSLEACLDEQLT
jgi:hypothetical protein